MKNATTQFEIVQGHYAKLTRDGKTLARVNKLSDGSWLAHVTGSPEWSPIATAALATRWIALQSLVL